EGRVPNGSLQPLQQNQLRRGQPRPIERGVRHDPLNLPGATDSVRLETQLLKQGRERTEQTERDGTNGIKGYGDSTQPLPSVPFSFLLWITFIGENEKWFVAEFRAAAVGALGVESRGEVVIFLDPPHQSLVVIDAECAIPEFRHGEIGDQDQWS